MALTRFGRGWSDAALKRQLDALAALPVNFDVPIDQMTVANGWTVDGDSEVPIGDEPPGPPVPGGLYDLAKKAIIDYDFSDPSIVVGHFDPTSPFVGRDILLEFKVFGFRYLNGCRVHSVREESTDGLTTFGFRYDTLKGHIEQGYEWFLLMKDHATGAIHFTIEAHWRLGDFPNLWTKVGFKVIGEHYRISWRHRAAARLRALAHAPVIHTPVSPGTVVHGGEEAVPNHEPSASARSVG